MSDNKQPSLNDLQTNQTVISLAINQDNNHQHEFGVLNSPPPHSFIFNDDKGREVGVLKAKDGVLVFEGNADEAATVFFNAVCRYYNIGGINNLTVAPMRLTPEGEGYIFTPVPNTPCCLGMGGSISAAYYDNKGHLRIATAYSGEGIEVGITYIVNSNGEFIPVVT